jgi:hypothetical protein
LGLDHAVDPAFRFIEPVPDVVDCVLVLNLEVALVSARNGLSGKTIHLVVRVHE